MRTIYLDNNATTRPADEVVEAMEEALRRYWHNPSSVHRPGQTARQQIELARHEIAALIGARDRDLVLTSGGTESDNLAILGSLAALPARSVLVTNRVEHSAVRETAQWLEERGTEVLWLDLGDNGLIDVDALAVILRKRADDIALVSIMWGNNETGVIQPVEAIGSLCREHGVRFHTDAVQWVGKMPTDVSSLPVDLLTFSAHKFHGPKGIGGLYVRRGIRVEPRAIGGSQERERRGGTENVPGVLGLGMAARLARQWLETDERDRLAALRDDFEKRLLDRVGDARVNGGQAPRIWSTANVGFRRLEAEAILLLLSERGVCASAGAACSSGSLDPSPILLAMGVEPEFAHGSVRFSLGRHTTLDELEEALEIVPEAIERLRGSMSAV